MYVFWKYLHVVGVVGFVAAHGTTAAVAFRLRKERDPGRLKAMLDLSRSTRPLMYLSLLLVVVSGIVVASETGAWQAAWVWWSIGLLAVLVVAAFPLAVPYYVRIRRAVDATLAGEAPPVAQLDALLRSPRAIVIAVVETAGILVIVWLMVARPG